MTDMPEKSPQQRVDELLGLMNLEEIEVDLFRGIRTSEPWVRVYGGQVIGQALMAACRTVDDDRPPHSLHAYFMRPGNPDLPIVYQVDRDRDGGSFSSRRVVAMQNGKPILNMAASFHKREGGLSHQFTMPEVPGPEGLASDNDLVARHIELIPEAYRATLLRAPVIEFRPVEKDSRFYAAPLPPQQHFWIRAVAPLPDDQLLHRVLLAYASDMMLLMTSQLPHSIHSHGYEMQGASLDHSVWFHDDIRIDDWLLYAMDSPWAGGARGFSRGQLFTRDGRLVASCAQEGLIRVLSQR